MWMLPLSTAVSLIELKSLHLWAALYNLMQRCRPVSSSAAAVEGCVKFSRAQHDTLEREGLHCLDTLAITWLLHTPLHCKLEATAKNEAR